MNIRHIVIFVVIALILYYAYKRFGKGGASSAG